MGRYPSKKLTKQKRTILFKSKFIVSISWEITLKWLKFISSAFDADSQSNNPDDYKDSIAG